MHRGQRKHKGRPGSQEGFLEEVMPGPRLQTVVEERSHKPKVQGTWRAHSRQTGGFRPRPWALNNKVGVAISCWRGDSDPQKDAVGEGCVTGLPAFSWELSLQGLGQDPIWEGGDPKACQGILYLSLSELMSQDA